MTAEEEAVPPPNQRTTRRLAAIMFTDMVGYTALAQSDEEQSLKVLERYNRLIRSFFSKYNGREVKTIGDSFLVEFDSALDAVKCAIEIQQSLHHHTVSSKEQWKTRLRIGIHLGDVVHKEGDILGDAVNIASRIQLLADPDGICISEQVFDQIHNKIVYPLQKLENTKLKHVRFQTNVYSIVFPWDEKDRQLVDDFKQSNLEPLRVAVLPFLNMSPDPADAYFADGMTEEIITTLSGISALSVISRTSVMSYKSTNKKLREIGKELEVGSVIEGSFRKAGNKIRISAQLVDVSSDRHLWAENYDRELDNVFQIQSEIAASIAGQLKIKLVGSEKQKFDTTDIDAYTMYMKAMQLLYESDEDSIRRSVELLDRSISRDSAFVRAIAGLSKAWSMMAIHRYEDWDSALKNAETAARRALQIGPDCAEAREAFAQVLHAYDRFEESISEAEKAIRINPNLSDAHFLLGLTNFFILGRQDEGLNELEKAHELDPLSVGFATVLAHAYDVWGRDKEALNLLSKLRDLNPRNIVVYDDLASLYLTQRDFQRAKEAIDAGMKIEPSSKQLQISLGILFAMTGDKENAKSMLPSLLDSKYETARLDAQLYMGAALGDLDEAFKALMRLAELHSWPYNVKLYPLFENLRQDPRFKEFCTKVGILAG